MSNKSITVRQLLCLLNNLPESKLDYEICANSDGNQISNNIVTLNVDEASKCVELTTE